MSAWLPASQRLYAHVDAGPNEPTRALWIGAGLDSGYSAVLAARLLNATVSPVHLVWDPSDGVIVQMLPASRTGLYRDTLPKGANKGALEILVLGDEPFTDGPMKGLDRIMEWVRFLGIPDEFPSGPGADTPCVSELPGHYAANAGSIDYRRVFRSLMGIHGNAARFP